MSRQKGRLVMMEKKKETKKEKGKTTKKSHEEYCE